MSEPFHVIRSVRSTASPDAIAPRSPHAEELARHPDGQDDTAFARQPADGHRESRLILPSESTRPGDFRQLYDNLQLVTGHTPRRLVVAPSSSLECIAPVVDGLASHATACGHDVLTARLELEGERPTMRWRHRDVHGIDLSPCASSVSSPIEGWPFARPRVDFVVIGAPPLTESSHAALLARECDGLVVVVQPMLTQRADVQVAVDRARHAGCRLLGFVMAEGEPKTRERQSWFARLRAFYRARR